MADPTPAVALTPERREELRAGCEPFPDAQTFVRCGDVLALLDALAAAEAERDEARASARTAWDVHAEHVERTNREALHDRSLLDEARTQRDEARAALARVEALADEYDRRHVGLADRNLGAVYHAVASRIRAALTAPDAPSGAEEGS